MLMTQAQPFPPRTGASAFLVLLVLFLTPALTGCGDGRETGAAAEADVPLGQAVFMKRCVSCHQPGGEGIPGIYPPLHPGEHVTGNPERVVRVMLHGLIGQVEVNGVQYTGAMPPWGGLLSDEEIAAVATYIRSAWGNDAPAIAAEDVARIRAETARRKTPWTSDELPAP